MTLSIPDLKRIAEAANTQGEWEQIDYRVFTKAPDFNYVCATANNAVTRVPEQYARATHIAAMNPTRTLALLEAFEAMREALEYILDVSPHDGSESACLWCDMGGAGYSSGGENHHDDIRRVCPVVKASQALAELDPSSAAEVGGGE